jgi:ATP-dependent Clp protease ATP-binding subunit ClpC
MRISVPVAIRQVGTGDPVWRIRPVLHPEPAVEHRELDHALQTMSDQLHRMAVGLSAAANHHALARLAADPGLEDRRVHVALDLRKATFSGEVLLAAHPMPGGLCCCPLELGDAWFQVPDQGDADAHIAAALGQVALRLLAGGHDLEALRAPRRGWITTIDLTISPEEAVAKPDHAKGKRARSGVGEGVAVDGAAELTRVGLCLGQGASDGPIWPRAALVDEVAGLLRARARRSLVLVGPSGVGKSALIDAVARRRRPDRKEGRIWHLAPGRLIAGMSYVGEWQARIQSICTHAATHDIVLHVDDLVGLLRAGAPSPQGIGIGRMMHAFIEDGRLRLLGEATPEVFQLVQELDRGFADALKVVRVEPLGEAQGVEAMIRLLAGVETGSRCRYTPDGLRAILEMARRIRPDRALPGGAADLVRALAAGTGRVDRDRVIGHVSRVSGIGRELLDTRVRMERAAFTRALQGMVFGQSEAVAGMVDALIRAKAGLNDPGRPLQSFLFLGPTGVGKTQCARALATALFGAPERMLRIDFNEYAGSDAVERLVGTARNPEGVLVGAIRRQPYAVVLLDEVEKANPLVFDLLLQVLGEARLCDGAGRFASFANAVIIMTSNLGADAAAVSGFGAGAQARAAGYHRAVEEFFRPEFVARIDRVVAFNSLQRDQLERIVADQLAELGRRSGLERHGQRLDVEAPVVRALAASCRSDALGARAVRRSIARAVAAPLARVLAAGRSPPGRVRVALAGGQPTLRFEPYRLAAARAHALPPALEPAVALARCLDLLARLDRARPSGPITLGAIDPRTEALFLLRERLERLRKRLQRSLDPRGGRPSRAHAEPAPEPQIVGRRVAVEPWWRAWRMGQPEQAQAAVGEAVELDPTWAALALAEDALESSAAADVHAERSVETEHARQGLMAAWRALGLTWELLDQGWRLSGPGAASIAAACAGLHLCRDDGGALWPLRLRVRPGDGVVAGAAGSRAAADGEADAEAEAEVVLVWDGQRREIVHCALGLMAPLAEDGACWAGWHALWLSGARP